MGCGSLRHTKPSLRHARWSMMYIGRYLRLCEELTKSQTTREYFYSGHVVAPSRICSFLILLLIITLTRNYSHLAARSKVLPFSLRFASSSISWFAWNERSKSGRVHAAVAAPSTTTVTASGKKSETKGGFSKTKTEQDRTDEPVDEQGMDRSAPGSRSTTLRTGSGYLRLRLRL